MKPSKIKVDIKIIFAFLNSLTLLKGIYFFHFNDDTRNLLVLLFCNIHNVNIFETKRNIFSFRINHW